MNQLAYRTLLAPLVLVCCAGIGCGGDTGGGDTGGDAGFDTDRPDGAPSLLPVEDVVVRVGDTARVALSVDNPQNVALTWSFQGPSLPGLASSATIGGTPSGGEFVYPPLSSHVGVHDFIVRIDSDLGGHEVGVRIVVEASADAAPVFLRPGPGGTFDLSRDPCVTFDIEVRDDDSQRVTLALTSAPEGAALDVRGDKRAEVTWCPTPAQANARDRWTFNLSANDDQHAETPHRFVAVLRLPAKEGCEGSPPIVTFISPDKGDELVSARGYTVIIDATDDIGLRDAPILYYSTSAPEDEDNPDLTEFSQVFFERDGTRWAGRVPSFGLAPGEQRIVWAVAVATDNDDPDGTSCDLTTTSDVLRFVAVGGEPDGGGGLCEACDTSSECASGVCAVLGSGRRCVAACSAECGEVCTDVATPSGSITPSCDNPATACGSGSVTCTDDEFEDDDDADTAGLVDPGTFAGVICADDDDWFAVLVEAGDELTVFLDGFVSADGDLDLTLLDEDERIVDQSAGAQNSEVVSVCSVDEAYFYARVEGYDGAQNSYDLTFDLAAGNCCVNDTFEPDNDADTARIIDAGDDLEGAICPGDEDNLAFIVDGPSRIQFELIFDSDTVDFELDLYNPNGILIAASRTYEDEFIDVEVETSGFYTARIYGYESADVGDWLAALSVDPLGGCTDTAECPGGLICDAGSCVDLTCASQADCPTGTLCSATDPDLSARLCRPTCSVNSDCDANACKWYAEGRACAPRGAGQNGDTCATASECGGQRACLDWTGGYCTRAACTSNTDCEGGTWCAQVDSGPRVCVLDCLDSDDICRLAEGYSCDLVEDSDGEVQFGCVP